MAGGDSGGVAVSRLSRFQRRVINRRDKRAVRMRRLAAEYEISLRDHRRRAAAFDWVYGPGAYNSSTFRAYWHRLCGGYSEDRLQQIEAMMYDEGRPDSLRRET